jgi:hypothetical protein
MSLRYHFLLLTNCPGCSDNLSMSLFSALLQCSWGLGEAAQEDLGEDTLSEPIKEGLPASEIGDFKMETRRVEEGL